MKIVLFFTLLTTLLSASTPKMPDKTYTTEGSVTDLLYEKPFLYVATSAGTIETFNTKTNSKTSLTKITQIKDFVGDTIDARIYSIDKLGNKTLILSQGSKGYRVLTICDNFVKNCHRGVSQKLYIQKAKFIDKERVLLGLLGNDIISYNLKSKTYNWIKQASMSRFSTFMLNEKRDKVVIADESGELHILNTNTGEKILKVSGQNLDNVFGVDFKNATILSGGQDRRVVVYSLQKKHAYYKKSSFIVYAVALSPSASLAAFCSDENNNITLFKTKTKEILGKYGSNKMLITKIFFLNENEFFVASDDNIINYYIISKNKDK